MSLSGNVKIMPLADLLQVHVTNRSTCAVKVEGADADGEIYLSDGVLKHATYADLNGHQAVYALLAAKDLYYELVEDTSCPQQTIFKDWQTLAMEAAQFEDEGKVPVIQPAPPRSRARIHEGKRKKGLWPWLAAAMVLLLAVSLPFALRPAAEEAPSPAEQPTSPQIATLEDYKQAQILSAPVEAADLSGPQDRKPVLKCADCFQRIH